MKEGQWESTFLPPRVTDSFYSANLLRIVLSLRSISSPPVRWRLSFYGGRWRTDVRESCAFLACSRSENSKPVANASRPLTPLSMNFRDSYSDEELVTGPVDNTALDRSRFHPTCKCCLSVSNTASRHFPRHFRFFEFHAQSARKHSRFLSRARVNKKRKRERNKTQDFWNRFASFLIARKVTARVSFIVYIVLQNSARRAWIKEDGDRRCE